MYRINGKVGQRSAGRCGACFSPRVSDDLGPAGHQVKGVVSELPRPKSFRRHLVRALPVFLSITVLTLVLEHAGWLRGFETAALDTSLRLIKPITPRFVQIVSINEDDYVHIFEGRSPLDAEKVTSLIEAIAEGDPRVIGVDIDTSDPQWKPLAPKLVASLRQRASIVWEREAIGEVHAR